MLLIIGALIITSRVTSILDLYKYIGMILSGIGTVMIARWYWWRVNPYSEIAAIATSFVVGNYLQIKYPSTLATDLFAVRVVIIMIVSTLVWVVVTYMTSKVPGKQITSFYLKMRIEGPGWGKVRSLTK